MKKFFEEFKAFALKGNMMDMAIGVIIGGAFSSITTSLVNDIINHTQCFHRSWHHCRNQDLKDRLWSV